MRHRTSLFIPQITVWTNRLYLCLSTSTESIPQHLHRLQICFPYTPVPCWCLETVWVTNDKGGSVTNANQIMPRLKDSHLPSAIGIVHCRSHQTDDSIVSKGNNWTDKAARAAALRSLDLSHPPQDILTLQPTSSPLTPAKLCPIFTNSFILIAKHYLPLLKLTYSPLLKIHIS